MSRPVLAMLVFVFACTIGITAPSAGFQGLPRHMPTPPPSSQPPSDTAPDPAAPDTRSGRKARLAATEKEFREGVERLYQLTEELREEVHQTTTDTTLSVRMYKKTEEIEKLAKQLKSKAKGG